jgi:uncharacterized membrane protein YqjE
MAVPESSGSDESPSLFASLRSFWGVLVAIFYTRLDLVTAELEDEAIRLAKFVASGLLSVLFLHTALFFGMFFLLALVWDYPEYRLLVLGLIFALYFIGGVALFFFARNMIVNRPKFLSQTLAELRRDAETLRESLPIKKEVPKP